MIQKGPNKYHWWTYSLINEHKNWYFDESFTLARYDISDSWSSKKMELSNVVVNKINKRDFMIPKPCLNA